MVDDEETMRNLQLLEYYKEQLNLLELQSNHVQTVLAEYHKAKMTIEHLSDTEETSDLPPPGFRCK